MFTFLKQIPHEEDLMVDDDEEIADKNDTGESILQSNHVIFFLISVAAVGFCLLLFWFIVVYNKLKSYGFLNYGSYHTG